MTRAALVTGGSGGIGLACARALQGRGVRVMICDIDETRGEAAAADIGGLFVMADLSRRADCRKAVDATVEAYGGLDILVNNAGFQHIDAIPDFPEDTWEDMLAVMLTAPFLLTKYAWEPLKRSGQGRVINIGSAHSLVASPYKAAYVSAKHGLVGLTRVAALEGGHHGITVNTVAPAYVRTAIVEGQIADQARTRGIRPEEVEEKVLLENVAVKRLLEPEDVANYVVFLASAEAWGITGSVQSIDLGWTAR
ncbi:3-hydroxybutyrate dehydrogenase [soil metagenome]|jgi:3-hydroxybutyrate dehydrogenase|nr:3-hydroxybutyrate dehydrogenase [Deinococcota bacterium]